MADQGFAWPRNVADGGCCRFLDNYWRLALHGTYPKIRYLGPETKCHRSLFEVCDADGAPVCIGLFAAMRVSYEITETVRGYLQMQTAVIFDCEFLVIEDAQRRFWCGPYDPDPIIVQTGAVKISLSDDFEILETLENYITPFDRYRNRYELDPFFTKLTGITPETIDAEGISLLEANNRLRDFAGDAKLWSWGKDELNMMAVSCYIAGIAPCLPATKFDNACRLLLASGMPSEDLRKTRSNVLADYFKLEHPALRGHDALDDALSVAYVIQHLLASKKLSPADFL